jgi:hypothetical protein
MSGKNQLEELARAHRAIVGILESPFLSGVTRLQLETFRDELAGEIAERQSEALARTEDGPIAA